MFQLILTVLSVALMSAAMLVSIQYVSPDAVVAKDIALRVERGLRELEQGFDLHVNQTGFAPASLADFTPKFAFVPPAIGGLQWGAGEGAGGKGNFLCLYGQANAVQIRALTSLQARLSPQAYFIGSTCGQTVQGSVPAPEGAETVSVAATYWVSSYL